MPRQDNFSLVIPTYHEVSNLPALLKRIAAVDFGDRQFEVIIVDDKSNDGTVECIQILQSQYPWLKLLSREGERSLSGAIFDGFLTTIYPLLVSMDADLSHPPEKIPALLQSLNTHEIAIGSRYIRGGSMDASWPLHRKFVSRLSALMTSVLLQIKVRDPLSGFVAIHKTTFENSRQLKTTSWKWGLELIVKCHCQRIAEIPIHFTERTQGYSKLNTKVAARYLQHLMQLCYYQLKI